VDNHFKTCVRYNERGHAHALTFSCCDRLPLLANDEACRLFLEALAAARKGHHFDMWAYVLMPEHVHLLIWPREPDYSISTILHAIKRPMSYRAKAQGLYRGVSFWLPGGGFDRNIDNARAIYEEIDYMHANPVRRGLCERPTDWKYSSARFWAGMTDAVVEMDRTLPQKDW